MKRPFYTTLYFRVLVAIALGVVLGVVAPGLIPTNRMWGRSVTTSRGRGTALVYRHSSPELYAKPTSRPTTYSIR